MSGKKVVIYDIECISIPGGERLIVDIFYNCAEINRYLFVIVLERSIARGRTDSKISYAKGIFGIAELVRTSTRMFLL